VYADSQHIDYEKYKDKIIELETLYGKKLSSVKTFQSMVDSIYRLFTIFTKMKTFKPEYAIFLINLSDKIHNLKDYVDNYNAQQTSSLQIGTKGGVFKINKLNKLEKINNGNRTF
jgi:hypothetical protein